MADAFKKVQRGQPLAIPAEAFNAFLDAASDLQSRRESRTQETQRVFRQTGIVRLKNGTGSDQDRFSILGLDRPIFTPDDRLDAFRNEVTLVGVEPNADEHTGRYGILLEPLRANGIGSAVVAGVAIVKIDVKEECHWFAEIAGGQTTTKHLQSGKEGSAVILWKEAGTGPKWAVIRLAGTDVGKSCEGPCPEDEGSCAFEARYVEGSTTETEWVSVEESCGGEEFTCEEPEEPPTAAQADAGEWTRTCCQPATTTTPAPCSGDCHWSWDAANGLWNLTSSTCEGDCQCAPPSYCGKNENGASCESTRSDCLRGGAPAAPDCGGGSTGGGTTPCPPTTTTLSPECTGCSYYFRFGRWWLLENGCNCGSAFCCGPPDGPGDECGVQVVTGCCAPPPGPPPVPCSGSCSWVGEPTTGRWVHVGGGCTPGNDGRPCHCAAPSFPGDDCNDRAWTGCYSPTTTLAPGATTTAGPCLPATTSTTPDPDSCTGNCRWNWTGSAWELSSSTCGSQCPCPEPAYDGTDGCETAETPCDFGTTTTSTTTTPAPNCCDLGDVWETRFIGLGECAFDEPITFTRVGDKDEWFYSGVLRCGDFYSVTARCDRSKLPNCNAFSYDGYFPCARNFHWVTNDDCQCSTPPYIAATAEWFADDTTGCKCCGGGDPSTTTTGGPTTTSTSTPPATTTGTPTTTPAPTTTAAPTTSTTAAPMTTTTTDQPTTTTTTSEPTTTTMDQPPPTTTTTTSAPTTTSTTSAPPTTTTTLPPTTTSTSSAPTTTTTSDPSTTTTGTTFPPGTTTTTLPPVTTTTTGSPPSTTTTSTSTTTTTSGEPTTTTTSEPTSTSPEPTTTTSSEPTTTFSP
jgi:hypothetical protein